MPFTAAGSSVSITLIADNTITAAVTVPPPTASTPSGTDATTHPAIVTVATAQPAPVVRQDRTAAPATVTVTTTTPAPLVRQDRTATPATLTVATTCPAPVVRQDRRVTVVVVPVYTAQPPPAVYGGATVDTAPAWAVTAGDLGDGDGMWVNVDEADGVPDLVCATWTAP